MEKGKMVARSRIQGFGMPAMKEIHTGVFFRSEGNKVVREYPVYWRGNDPMVKTH